MTEKEQWRPVCGYEGKYDVSNFGDVRSLSRTRNARGRVYKVRGRTLKRIIDSTTKYFVVNLSNGPIVKKLGVHTLVLEAFVGPRPEGKWGLHNDGDRQNPRLDNLRWGTPAENSADMLTHGTAMTGARSPLAVLTPEIVGWIRESRQSSLALAPVLGVASSTIRAVRLRQNWAHQ